MDRATVVDRKGTNQKFMGASSYSLKANWLGGVTLFADGVPVAFYWRPISMNVGLASVEDVDSIIQARDEHRAKLMGVKL